MLSVINYDANYYLGRPEIYVQHQARLQRSDWQKITNCLSARSQTAPKSSTRSGTAPSTTKSIPRRDRSDALLEACTLRKREVF